VLALHNNNIFKRHTDQIRSAIEGEIRERQEEVNISNTASTTYGKDKKVNNEILPISVEAGQSINTLRQIYPSQDADDDHFRKNKESGRQDTP